MSTAPRSPIGMLALAEGFFGAGDRLQVAMQTQDDPNRTFIPLFESLNWLVAIDDRLRRDGHEWDGRALEFMMALRYARGRVHHQWADAIEVRDDVVIPRATVADLGGGRWGFKDSDPHSDWCWRAVNELPLGDREVHDRGREEYAAHLAGETVRHVIGIAHDYVVTPVWTHSGGIRWPRD